jgi:hypothetical protein
MTWEQTGITLFAFATVCEQAHVLTPIVLAIGVAWLLLRNGPRSVRFVP